MKNYLIIILVMALFGQVKAQNKVNEDEANQITLSVILPDNSEYLSRRALSKIESKIQHIVSRYGISGQGYTNDFLIYPKFEIYDESMIEAGMQNIHTVEAEFNLFIKQYRNNKVFASYSKTVHGSGYTKEKAIINAIQKISVSDPKLKKFIEEGKRKILAYYNNNCGQFEADAKTAIKMKRFNKAIAILSTIPREAKQCYARIQNLSVQAYNAYQKQHCKEQIQAAKADLANNDYSRALYDLKYVDPLSPCGPEAKLLINKAAAKVDARERKEWNFMLKRYNDRLMMEKYRLNIAKEIAKAYYNSKPKTVIYKSLF